MDDTESAKGPGTIPERKIRDRPSDSFIEQAYEELSREHKEIFDVLRRSDYNQEAIDVLWKIITTRFPDRDLGFRTNLITRIELLAKGIPPVDIEQIRQQMLEERVKPKL